MSIEITGVTKRFGDFVALEDVNVAIPTGQLTALLGPSGGGKSTLLRVIAGLDTADAGTIEIEASAKSYLGCEGYEWGIKANRIIKTGGADRYPAAAAGHRVFDQ